MCIQALGCTTWYCNYASINAILYRVTSLVPPGCLQGLSCQPTNQSPPVSSRTPLARKVLEVQLRSREGVQTSAHIIVVTSDRVEIWRENTLLFITFLIFFVFSKIC